MNLAQQREQPIFLVENPNLELSKEILLVSNCRETSTRLCHIIKKLNHNCNRIVSTYFKADKQISEQEPDIVIISSELEGDLNGFDAAKYIKLDYDLPFIFVQKEETFESLKWSTELNPDANLFLSHSDEKLMKQIEFALY